MEHNDETAAERYGPFEDPLARPEFLGAIEDSEKATRGARWWGVELFAAVFVSAVLVITATMGIVYTFATHDPSPPEWQTVIVKDPARLWECMYHKHESGFIQIIDCGTLDVMPTGNADIWFVNVSEEGDY
jgi:hypothetical protein